MTATSDAGLSRLGTVTEPRVAVVVDTTDPEPLVAFWTAALGYAVTHAGEPFTVLAPPAADRPELVVQRVSDLDAGGRRVHIDLLVDDLEAAVGRLESLGAQPAADGVRTYGDHRWRVLADPQGNVFCVVAGISP